MFWNQIITQRLLLYSYIGKDGYHEYRNRHFGIFDVAWKCFCYKIAQHYSCGHDVKAGTVSGYKDLLFRISNARDWSQVFALKHCQHEKIIKNFSYLSNYCDPVSLSNLESVQWIYNCILVIPRHYMQVFGGMYHFGRMHLSAYLFSHGIKWAFLMQTFLLSRAWMLIFMCIFLTYGFSCKKGSMLNMRAVREGRERGI